MANQNSFTEFLKDEIADTSELKEIFMDLLTNHKSWIDSATKNNHLKVADSYKTLAPVFEGMNKKQKKAMVTLLEHEYYSSINHFLEKIDDDENVVIGYHQVEYPHICIVDNVSQKFDKIYFKRKEKEVKFGDILNKKKYKLVVGDSEDFCNNESYFELFNQLRSIAENDINFEIINNSNDDFVNIRLVSGDIFIDFKLELETDWLYEHTLRILNSFVQKISTNDKRFAFVYPSGVQNTGQEYSIAFIEKELFLELLSRDFISERDI
jgi:hypothetical protein